MSIERVEGDRQTHQDKEILHRMYAEGAIRALDIVVSLTAGHQDNLHRLLVESMEPKDVKRIRAHMEKCAELLMQLEQPAPPQDAPHESEESQAPKEDITIGSIDEPSDSLAAKSSVEPEPHEEREDVPLATARDTLQNKIDNPFIERMRRITAGLLDDAQIAEVMTWEAERQELFAHKLSALCESVSTRPTLGSAASRAQCLAMIMQGKSAAEISVLCGASNSHMSNMIVSTERFIGRIKPERLMLAFEESARIGAAEAPFISPVALPEPPIIVHTPDSRTTIPHPEVREENEAPLDYRQIAKELGSLVGIDEDEKAAMLSILNPSNVEKLTDAKRRVIDRIRKYILATHHDLDSPTLELEAAEKQRLREFTGGFYVHAGTDTTVVRQPTLLAERMAKAKRQGLNARDIERQLLGALNKLIVCAEQAGLGEKEGKRTLILTSIDTFASAARLTSGEHDALRKRALTPEGSEINDETKTALKALQNGFMQLDPEDFENRDVLKVLRAFTKNIVGGPQTLEEIREVIGLESIDEVQALLSEGIAIMMRNRNGLRISS